MSGEFAEVDVEVLRETDSAYLVSNGDEDFEPIWIPKSQVDDITENPGSHQTLWVAEWLAEKEGLI